MWKSNAVGHLMSKMIERWRYLLAHYPLKAREWNLYKFNKCAGHVLFRMHFSSLAVVASTNLDTESDAIAVIDDDLFCMCSHLTSPDEGICFLCFCKLRSNPYFNTFATASVSTLLLGKIWSHTPEPVKRENAIPLWANRWRWLIPLAPPNLQFPPKPSELAHYKKRYQTTLVAENAKRGKKKKKNESLLMCESR